MKNSYIKVALITLLLVSTSQANDSSNIAATAKFGTLGFGIDATLGLEKQINLRLNINKGKVDLDEADRSYISDGGVDLFSAGVLADYHPYDNGFRVSAGVYYNGNNLDVTDSIPQDNVQIGNKVYDLTKNTKTHVEITPNSVAPYVGVGWGNAISNGSSWNFSFDVGVLYQGKPKATVTMSGTAKDHNSGEIINLETNNIFKDNLAKEQSSFKSDVEDLQFYPVISFGISYKF